MKIHYHILIKYFYSENYFCKKIVFIGCSNVGKSSLINALTNSKVARVGKNPGTTDFLNFYALRPKKIIGYLVDTPGYGIFALVNI